MFPLLLLSPLKAPAGIGWLPDFVGADSGYAAQGAGRLQESAGVARMAEGVWAGLGFRAQGFGLRAQG